MLYAGNSFLAHNDDMANDTLDSNTRRNIAVIVATKGRPECVQPFLQALDSQTCKPRHVIYVITSQRDIPDGIDNLGLAVNVIVSSAGSSLQRNRGIDRIQSEAEILIFFDDDFLPASDWIENCCTIFSAFSDVAGLSGMVLKDGAITGPITWAEGRDLLTTYKMPTTPRVQDIASTYGCNMAFRSSDVGDERFDERLVLYGWMEDNDFSRRISRRGRLVTSDTLVGVHLSIQRGRVSGKRLGYSQVVNPVYLARKGSLPWSEAVTTILRPVCANLLKSLRPEAHIDRRGRLIGNLLGFGELMRLRSRPEQAARINSI